MKLDICPTLLIKIAVLLPCGIFIQSWLSFPNIYFHTWYWWAKEKNSFHWLYRFLEPSIFSRSPQISHLKFQSVSLGARQPAYSLSLQHAAVLLHLAVPLGFSVSWKASQFQVRSLNYIGSLPKISWLFRDQSPRTSMELLLCITPELQTYHQHVHYDYLPTYWSFVFLLLFWFYPRCP